MYTSGLSWIEIIKIQNTYRKGYWGNNLEVSGGIIVEK